MDIDIDMCIYTYINTYMHTYIRIHIKREREPVQCRVEARRGGFWHFRIAYRAQRPLTLAAEPV
jgi:hypothetical protein